MVWGGLIAAAGSIAGGLIGAEGQRDANASSAASVREQMRFQEEAYKKRYRWQMEDMRLAGLNPLYSAVQSPGAAPSGAAYTAQNELAPLGQGVSAAAGQAATVAQQYAQTKNIKAQTDVARAQAANIAADTMLKHSSAREVEARTPTHAANIELSTAQTQLAKDRQLVSVMEAAVKKQSLSIMEKELLLAQMDIDIYQSSVGGVARWLQTLGVSPAAARGLAGSLIRLFR